MQSLALQLGVSALAMFSPVLEYSAIDAESEIARLGGAETEQAVAALIELGKPAVKPLLVVLADGEVETAWLAARALRGMGKAASSGKSKFARALKDKELDAERQLAYCLAVGGLGKSASSMSKSLIQNLEGADPAVTILSAMTLVDIGEASAADVGKVAKENDLFVAVWAMAVLNTAEEASSKAVPSVRKIYDGKTSDKNNFHYVLAPLCARVFDNLGTSYEEATSLNEAIRVSGIEVDPRMIAYRGSTLWNTSTVEDAKDIRKVVLHLSGGPADSKEVIDLPKQLDDIDFNDSITDGELIALLADHLVTRFDELKARFQRNQFKTHKEWKAAIEALSGLNRVYRIITTAEYLERTGALNLTTRSE